MYEYAVLLQAYNSYTGIRQYVTLLVSQVGCVRTPPPQGDT